MKKYFEWVFILLGIIVTICFFVYLILAMFYGAVKNQEEKKTCLQYKNNLISEIPAYCLKYFKYFN